jgi:hypothetical protein
MRERSDISASIETIVWRLLRKAPEDRFQTAADLVWALEQPSSHTERVRARIEPATAEPTPRVRARTWIVALAAAVLIALTWSAWSLGHRSGVTPNTEVARFNWPLPPNTGLWSAPVVSPDGRRIVWAGIPRLVPHKMRDLSSDESHAPRHDLRVSRSGRRMAAGSGFARRKLQKIAAAGGPVTTSPMRRMPEGAPESCGRHRVPTHLSRFSLLRVSDRGGRHEPVTTLISNSTM